MASLNAERLYDIASSHITYGCRIIENFELEKIESEEYSQEDWEHIFYLKKQYFNFESRLNCALEYRDVREEIIGIFHDILLRAFEWNCIMEGKGEEFRAIRSSMKVTKKLDKSRVQDFLKFENETMTSLKFRSRFAIPVKPLFNFRYTFDVYNEVVRKFVAFQPGRNVELLVEYERLQNKVMSKCFGNFEFFDEMNAFAKKWNNAMKENGDDEESYDPLSEEITEGSYYLKFKLQEF